MLVTLTIIQINLSSTKLLVMNARYIVNIVNINLDEKKTETNIERIWKNEMVN